MNKHLTGLTLQKPSWYTPTLGNRGLLVMNQTRQGWMVAGLLLGTMAYAIAEEVTLTTYYPSPRGVYQELRSTENTFLAIESGRVGIGTTEPTTKLQIEGSMDADTSIRINQPGRDDWFITNAGLSADLEIGTMEGLPYVTILSTNGNVGIGTAPGVDRRLHVAGGDLLVQRSAATPWDYVNLGVNDPNIGLELRSGNTGGTPYIDFGNDQTSDYDMRIKLTSDDTLGVEGGTLMAERVVINGGLRLQHSGSAVVTCVPNGTVTITHNLGIMGLVFVTNGHYEVNPVTVIGAESINANEFHVHLGLGGGGGDCRLNWMILE